MVEVKLGFGATCRNPKPILLKGHCILFLAKGKSLAVKDRGAAVPHGVRNGNPAQWAWGHLSPENQRGQGGIWQRAPCLSRISECSQWQDRLQCQWCAPVLGNPLGIPVLNLHVHDPASIHLFCTALLPALDLAPKLHTKPFSSPAAVPVHHITVPSHKNLFPVITQNVSDSRLTVAEEDIHQRSQHKNPSKSGSQCEPHEKHPGSPKSEVKLWCYQPTNLHLQLSFNIKILTLSMFSAFLELLKLNTLN